MARIRTIKPEFWTDEKIVAMTPLARLLFVGLWNFADDDGRGEYSPRRMKMQILPADSTDISELLGEIRREGLIVVYSVDGKEYFEIKGFSKHQKVDKRSASKYPRPSCSAESPRVPPTDQGREGIKEGKGSNSETIVSGAEAPAGNVHPIDARTALFRDGLDTLSAITGRPATGLRSVVGRWLKMAGDDCASVRSAIDRAQEHRVADPIPWIERSLKPRDPDAAIYRAVL